MDSQPKTVTLTVTVSPSVAARILDMVGDKPKPKPKPKPTASTLFPDAPKRHRKSKPKPKSKRRKNGRRFDDAEVRAIRRDVAVIGSTSDVAAFWNCHRTMVGRIARMAAYADVPSRGAIAPGLVGARR